MQELEKILEEIREYANHVCGDFSKSAQYIAGAKRMIRGIEDIISKHMNAGWIPVEERLPEVNRMPAEDDECPEFNVTIRGAEKATTLKYSPADHAWFDDNGYVYDVIAWRPMPDVYRPADKTERSDDK